jgi:DNA-binding CsgD family transcriptional regulator
VIRALGPMLALRGRDGIDEPGVVPWHDLLVDAWVAVGEYPQAAALLEWWEPRTADRGRHSTQAAAARARGNLEAARRNPAAADRAFQTGLEHAHQVDEPFGQALVESAYGRFLRRIGRRTAAATQLHRARDTFTRLEAHPDLERCERELVGCGLSPAKRDASAASRLTPQELAVARLAASGRTNRQAAAELVVSVKTVEYHLAKVYTKLAITSRSELGSRLNQPRDLDVDTSQD